MLLKGDKHIVDCIYYSVKVTYNNLRLSILSNIMDRHLEPVDSESKALTEIRRLERIENEEFGETSRRWAIEFNERYRSLEQGLYELDIEVDPSEVLTAIDEQDYDLAKDLLDEEDNYDGFYNQSPDHRTTSVLD